jgi:hypothetical protein
MWRILRPLHLGITMPVCLAGISPRTTPFSPVPRAGALGERRPPESLQVAAFLSRKENARLNRAADGERRLAAASAAVAPHWEDYAMRTFGDALKASSEPDRDRAIERIRSLCRDGKADRAWHDDPVVAILLAVGTVAPTASTARTSPRKIAEAEAQFREARTVVLLSLHLPTHAIADLDIWRASPARLFFSA